MAMAIHHERCELSLSYMEHLKICLAMDSPKMDIHSQDGHLQQYDEHLPMSILLAIRYEQPT